MSEQEIIQNPHTHHCPPILFGYDEAEGILVTVFTTDYYSIFYR